MRDIKTKNNFTGILTQCAAWFAVIAFIFLLMPNTTALADESLTDLHRDLRERHKEIEEMKRQSEIYEETIVQKQNEAASLKNQLAIFDNRIAKAELDIKVTAVEIETTEIEIETTAAAIVETEEKIAKGKENISGIIQQMHQLDQRSALEILLVNDSFAEFFEQLSYLESVQGGVQDVLNEVQELKKELDEQQSQLEQKKDDLVTLKDRLKAERSRLVDQKAAKEIILAETFASEERFQILLGEVRQEQEQANLEILQVEREIREKLTGKRERGELSLDGFHPVWPVNPVRGISAYFHDPSYPYKHIFEHPAVDIPNSQGNAIRAAETGYVARAKDSGMGYSYIMIVHDDGFSTVYGHVSRIDVLEDDFVLQGQVIGAVGGRPGTRGAGRLTTGSHLHLEFRKDGIPVNPLNFLP